MRRNNKELLHIFYRETNGAVNFINTICNNDLEKLSNMHPNFVFMLLRLEGILKWAEDNFDLFEESKEWENNNTTKDMERTIGTRCLDCDSPDPIFFVVNKELWDEYGVKDKTLCWECFEKRIGRKLTKDDFITCALNDTNSRIADLKKSKKKNILN